MRKSDWLALLSPPHRDVLSSLEATLSPPLGSLALLHQARQEVCSDLLESGLVPLVLNPMPSSFPRNPRLDLLLDSNHRAPYLQALRRTVEPRESWGTHFSGLRVYFHTWLPGGPDHRCVLNRSSVLADGSRLPDRADRLWIGGLLSMLHRGTNWYRGALDLIHDFEDEDWSQLLERESTAVRLAIRAIVEASNLTLAHRVQAWLEGPLDRLTEDLILHGLASEIGLQHIRAFVGWPRYLRHRFLASKELRQYRLALATLR